MSDLALIERYPASLWDEALVNNTGDFRGRVRFSYVRKEAVCFVCHSRIHSNCSTCRLDRDVSVSILNGTGNIEQHRAASMHCHVTSSNQFRIVVAANRRGKRTARVAGVIAGLI